MTQTELAFAAAQKHEHAGHFARAEQVYREILKNEPKNLDAILRLGSLALQFRHYAAATELMQQCVAMAPDLGAAHFGLGRALLASDQADLAIAPLSRATELSPNVGEMHMALGDARLGAGDLVGAIESYERACELRPDAVVARQKLSPALRSGRRFEEAVRTIWEAVVVQPRNLISWEELAVCITETGSASTQAGPDHFFDGLSELGDFDARQFRAAVDHWVRQRHPIYDTVTRIVGSQLANAESRAIELTLFCGLLGKVPINDLKLENELCKLRSALLQLIASDGIEAPADGIVALTCSLAMQCFLNEFLYPESETETTLVNELVSKAGRAPNELTPFELSILGAYRPLHQILDASGAAAAHRTAVTGPLAAMVRMQVIEPERELAIRDQIPRLTEVDDQTSRTVQNQYEENPYPRWRDADFGFPESVKTVLTSLYPHLNEQNIVWPTEPRVLVAGCGTGRHPIVIAHRFEYASILAIDLSLPNLAYAFRRATELSLHNIYFARADILKLKDYAKRFEIVEAVGVLHHLDEPREGLRILNNLLVPGGFMRLGLYSETGRSAIAAARDFIAERGCEPDIESMRRFREEIQNLPENHPAREIISAPDFYTVSELRDLVFHVQEHRYTLPAIKELLAGENLEFVGFEFGDQSVRSRYRELFPADRDANSLENWDRFEQENPETFRNMYMFWARKR